jgi:PAS domain S-box-containing protein
MMEENRFDMHPESQIGEETYQLLVKEVRDYAIFMLDTDGYVRTWNIGAEQLTGYKADEIIGKHFSCFYREDDIQAGKPQRVLEMTLKDGRFEEEDWRVRKDRSEFWANVVMTALYGENRRHCGFSNVTRDLTARKQAEDALRNELGERCRTEIELRTAQEQLQRRTQELAEANEGLARASRMKDQFLAVLSHELRTPLTSVYGWVEILLKQELDDPMLVQALDVIQRNVKAQTRLVDDLLNLSRIITGKVKIKPDWIDPASVIKAAVDSVRPAASAKGIEIAVDTYRSELIFADSERLQQVIWNLLTNAVKFTEGGGEVRVEFGRVGSKFEISVTDTGEGIDPSFLPFVFDPFAQADPSAARRHGGLGLGLSIVRHIVQMHGGSVMAHSEGKGKGTTMIVRLPIPAISETRTRKKEHHAASLHGLKIMVVEDEADTRQMLRVLLEQYGASVMVASSAAEALKALTERKPDVLISDLGMPDMDGFELIKKIRTELPADLQNVPALALSAYATADDKEKCVRAGYQAHVSKPAPLDDLLTIVRKLAHHTS